MELVEVIRRRRMVRTYDPREAVTEDALAAVLEAARRAPSAGFTQGVSCLVLTSEDDRTAFWQATSHRDSAWLRSMQTAPALVLVWTSQEAYLDRYAEPDKGWSDRDAARWSAPYWFVDAGMAAMAALLTAVDQGLGACFFGIPVGRVPAVREQFGVPDGQLSVGVISLGVPAAGPGAAGGPVGSARRRRRKAETEVVHLSRW